MHLLVVKTSSLGDVIHTLPALTDAVLAHPGLRCDWLVENAFAEIPAWHPAVARVIPCALRAWLRQPLRALSGEDWKRCRAQLHETAYDAVIDAQGLVKSALLARQARGKLHGPGFGSAREPLAALFYPHRHAVPKHDAAHAVTRARTLFAAAVGYTMPDSPPDAGLDPAHFPRPEIDGPYAMLLHGTTWPGKRWPREHWRELADWLAQRGIRPVLAWGSEAERRDAETIATAGDGLALPQQGLAALAGWLAHARVVIGVDTGLMHLAAAIGTPGLSLYGATLPELTGAVGANQVWLRSDDAAKTIDRDRLNTVTVARVQQALSDLGI